MEIAVYILLGLSVILIVLLAIVLVMLLKKKEQTAPGVVVDQSETLTQINFVQESLAQLKVEMEKAFVERFMAQTKSLNESDAKFLQTMRDEFDKKLSALNKDVQEKLKLDAEKGEKTFEDLGKRMQAIVEANKEVVSLGEDVKKLSDVISGGGARKGQFGEFLLENILDEVFASTTNMFVTQQSIGNVRPDAIIYLPRKEANMLCIDAKFTYDNYAKIYDENHNVVANAKKDFKNDVKARINEVKDKYIIPGKTIEYALCFFPSDEIYQFINTDKDFVDIVRYARRHNVVLVSPATLQPTLHTLKSLMIEYRRSQKLAEVNKMITELAIEFDRLAERYESFMKTYDALRPKRDQLDITVNKLVNKFERIKDDSEGDIEEDL
ncbi:MAG: DNA recombination protein RmuC [Bacilli bacterium]